MLEDLTHIVFHHSAGPRTQKFADIERFHITPEREGGRGFRAIGYHVVIEEDGALCYGRPLPHQGAHAEGWNDRSIGVCLVGDNTKPGHVWTPAQIVAARRYVEALTLVVPRAIIVPHRDTKNTLCPGIDRDRLLRMLGRA